MLCNTLNVQSHVSFYALILPDEAHWGKVEYCGCANLLINNLLALMLRIQPAKSVSTMVQALWLTLNKARRINYKPNFLSQLCHSCMSLTSAWCQFYWQQSVSPAQICHLSFLYLALIRTPVFSYSRNKHFIIWQMRKVPEVQCESSHLIEKNEFLFWYWFCLTW